MKRRVSALLMALAMSLSILPARAADADALQEEDSGALIASPAPEEADLLAEEEASVQDSAQDSGVLVTALEVAPIRRFETDRNNAGQERIDCWPEWIQVTTQQGTYAGEPNQVEEELKRDYPDAEIDMYWYSDESSAQPWGVGLHEAFFNVCGTETAYTVEVIASPIQSVEVQHITRFVTDRHESWSWEGEEEVKWYAVDCWPEFIRVTTVDGVYEGRPDNVEEQLRAAYPDDRIDCYYQTGETQNDLWEAGTHEAYFTVCGVTCAYQVEVIDSPVTAVQVSPVTRFVTDRYDEWDWTDDGEIHWKKLDVRPDTVEVTADGNTYSGDPDDVRAALEQAYPDLRISVDWWSEEERDHPWEAGTYQAVFSVCGVQVDYDVVVVDSPVKKITVNPVTRYDSERFFSSDWDEETQQEIEWNKLDCAPKEFTVETDYGTFSGSSGEVADQLEKALEPHYPNLRIDIHWESGERYDNLWRAGESYTCFLYVCGVEAEYTVNVIASPILSVSVEPIIRLETDTFFNGDFYAIDCWPRTAIVTVETSKGTVTGTVDGEWDGEQYHNSIQEQLGQLLGTAPDIWWYSDQNQSRQTWKPGKHTAVFYVGGVLGTYDVTVIESPIQSVEIDPVYLTGDRTDDTQAFDCDWFIDPETGAVMAVQPWRRLDCYPRSMTVRTDKGTYSGDMHGFYEWMLKQYGVSVDLHWNNDETPDRLWGPGEHQATLYLSGVSYPYSVYIASTAQDISGADVTLAEQTYTGKALTPSPVVLLNGKKLAQGTDYTVEYKNNTDAGIAAVTVRGIGSYSGEVSSSFTIAKAAQSLKVTAPASVTIGKAAGITVQGIGSVGYTSGNTKIATVTSKGAVNGIAPGEAVITVTAAGDGNHLSAVQKVKIKVECAAPAISKVENVNGGVKVTWSKVAGAVNYRVYYKTAKGKWTKAGDTTGTTLTWKKAVSGTAYSFTVRPITSDGKSSTGGYNTTGKSITYIAMPSISKAENVNGGIKLTWSKIAGASQYRIFYKSGKSGWTKLADTASTTYTWKGAKSGTTYAFTVRCLSKDKKSYTSAYHTTGKSLTCVSAPALSSLSNSKARTMTAAWKKVSGITGYQIQYSTDKGFKSGNKVVTVKKASAVSQAVSGLTKGKTYYVRIRAYKTVSGKNTFSAWSTVKSVKIAK